MGNSLSMRFLKMCIKMMNTKIIVTFVCCLCFHSASAQIQDALNHYKPSHPEVIDVLPGDFSPIVESPATEKLEPVQAVIASGAVPLGESLDQLIREIGHPGSLAAIVKQNAASYVGKLENIIEGNTMVLQFDE